MTKMDMLRKKSIKFIKKLEEENPDAGYGWGNEVENDIELGYKEANSG